MTRMTTQEEGGRRALRLLIVSYTLPQVGGLETMVRLMARECSRLGTVDVRILSPNAGDWEPALTRTTLHRQPSVGELAGHYAWADAVFFNHFYLRQALPLLWRRGLPCVVSVSGYAPPRPGMNIGARVRAWLMVRLLRRAAGVIACNTWCRDLLPVPAEVVPNPYDDERFQRRMPVEGRPGDLLFAGRINEVKGCQELVEAYAEVARQAAPGAAVPRLTIAGEGPLRPAMEARLAKLGLAGQVQFCGPVGGDELAALMNQHRVLVVPSRYLEPVGIVALEGLASGCVVVASNGGGLGETVGPHGFTFNNGDAAGLSAALQSALSLSDAERASLLHGVDLHLDRYRAVNVVKGYLNVVKASLPAEVRTAVSLPGLAAP